MERIDRKQVAVTIDGVAAPVEDFRTGIEAETELGRVLLSRTGGGRATIESYAPDRVLRVVVGGPAGPDLAFDVPPLYTVCWRPEGHVVPPWLRPGSGAARDDDGQQVADVERR